MKQQYIIPTVRIQQIDTEAMLAGSLNGSGLKGVAGSPALGKENDMEWDEDMDNMDL